MATAYEILNRTRNAIDTAQTGWSGYAEACVQAYDSAYALHAGALKAVSEDLKLQAESVWKVFNIVLVGFGGYWVGKFLKPVTGSLDEVAAGWVKDTIEGMGSEAKSLIKDTALDELKKKAIGGTNDPYEPVVESTLIYGSRLKEGIYKRAEQLKQKMDALIKNSDHWTVTAALDVERSFNQLCPFIVDKPKDSGDEFKKTFQRESELAMWVKWALERDEKWWREKQRSSRTGEWMSAKNLRITMRPVMDRLLALGAPLDKIASLEYHGTTVGGGRIHILDMIKFIEWAKAAPANKGTPVAARKTVAKNNNVDLWLWAIKNADKIKMAYDFYLAVSRARR